MLSSQSSKRSKKSKRENPSNKTSDSIAAIRLGLTDSEVSRIVEKLSVSTPRLSKPGGSLRTESSKLS